ncbi:MAG: alpha/beta hydrolase fold domain-containing protein [Vicinamibacterales bacterium]
MTFPVEVVLDLRYAAPDDIPLLADLYVPRGIGSPPPVIVWVHGGGWRFGNRRLGPDLSRFFARSGFAMAAVDYRLSDQATFPAQIDDLKTAIRWVRSVAKTYGLDSARVGLLGSSAGGHLSALAGLAPCEMFEPADALYLEHSSSVQAVVDGYGPTDFLQIDSHRPPDDVVSDDPETVLLPRGMTRSAAPDSFESLLLGAPIETCPDRVGEANPITYAAQGAPPFLILHGCSDTTVPAHQSELLYDALAAHDAEVSLCLIDGLGHGFLNRTHLDDGPARRVTLKRHEPGGGEQVEQGDHRIFAMIESFFRTHVAHRTVRSIPTGASAPGLTPGTGP